jgi:Flp pilus assembly pilin Flp
MSTHALRRLGRRTLGQSMTEVVVIVFLVGIGCIGIVGLFGDNIRGLFGGSAASLAGNPDVSNPGKESNKSKWSLRGGELSAYGTNSFNPGGSADAPQSAPAPSDGNFPGGGFNPGGSGSDGSQSSN